MRPLVIVALLCALPPSAPIAARPAQVEQPRQPTFHASVDLVELPVTVLDARGRTVGDLRLDDFELRVDGAKHPIEFFRHVQPPTSVGAASTTIASPPDTISNAGGDEPRTIVVLLDDVHVSPLRTPTVRRVVRELIEARTTPADLVSVLTVSGDTGTVQDFTSDRARLLGVAANLSGRRTGEVGHQEQVHNLRSTLATLERFATLASQLRGRRVVVLFISEGSEYNLFDRADLASGEIANATSAAMRELRQSTVTIYALDPRGLSRSHAEMADERVQEVETNDIRRPGPRARMLTQIRGLEQLSVQTGGFAIVNRNDFGKALEQMAAHASDYYLLGFYPPPGTPPGAFRKVALSTTRPHTRAVTRSGFVALSRRARNHGPADRRAAMTGFRITNPAVGAK